MQKWIAGIGLLAFGSPIAFVAPACAAEPSIAEFQGATPARPIRYRLVLEPDAAAENYQGEVRIDFELTQAVREIVLHGAGLVIDSAREGKKAAQISLDEHNQLVRLAFEKPLIAGRHELDVSFRGRIASQGTGLIRVESSAADGVAKRSPVLYSALCCRDKARFLMPMWDIASLKASIELELRISNEAEAVSAMPIARRRALGGGRVSISFRPTPPVSPYLCVFAIGELERLTASHGRTPIAIVLPWGKASQASYALAATGEALSYLERYLDEPYPLPKLDALLLPGARGGAVSSWGAIQYAERYLMVSAQRSSAEELFTTSAMVAHEVAHQWFGNLLSPTGPGDRWLSEGVAVWLENSAMQALHPEWRPWLRAIQYREAAMRIDVGDTAHPIAAAPAPSAKGTSEAPQKNEIIYDKSAQVLRMLEAFAGRDAFQAAIREFIDRNRFRNVTSDDLWASLERSGLREVAGVGRDFTVQSGVPLIEVSEARCIEGSTLVRLTQSRFSLDGGSRKLGVWRVPVTAMSLKERKPVSAIVHREQPVELSVPGCGAVKVNVGNVGYFRTRYDESSFQALRQAFADLDADDRVGLLQDEAALAEAEYEPYARYLDLVTATR